MIREVVMIPFTVKKMIAPIPSVFNPFPILNFFIVPRSVQSASIRYPSILDFIGIGRPSSRAFFISAKALECPL